MAPRRRNLTPSQLARLWPLTPYRVCSGAADQHRIPYYVQWLPFRRGWRFCEPPSSASDHCIAASPFRLVSIRRACLAEGQKRAGSLVASAPRADAIRRRHFRLATIPRRTALPGVLYACCGHGGCNNRFSHARRDRSGMRSLCRESPDRHCATTSSAGMADPMFRAACATLRSRRSSRGRSFTGCPRAARGRTRASAAPARDSTIRRFSQPRRSRRRSRETAS